MVVGSVVNMAIIMTNMTVLYPMPEGLDMADSEAMTAYVATLPVMALLLVIVAHLGQASVGGWVAARLAGSHPMRLAMVVGTLSMLGGVANMFNIGGPAWMWVEMPLYLAVAYAAGRLEVKRREGLGEAPAG
jgi:hypothetical protein